MKQQTEPLLQKAQAAIGAVQTLLRNQNNDFAVSRAYYAMLYVAEALLNEKGLHFSTHDGVQGAFDEYYVKPGLFPARYQRWLLDSFDQRLRADYSVGLSFPDNVVQELIEQAEEFLQAARRYLENEG